MVADAVFLHIGAPKTGSTYIQHLLWTHKTELEELGAHLPFERRRAHLDAVGEIRGGDWHTPSSPWTWQALVDEVNEHPGKAVISEELMVGATDEQIDRMANSFGPTPVHIVVTSRDLLRQFPAEWQNQVRTRATTSFAQWMVDLRDDPSHSFWTMQDPACVFERWGRHVPKERFHIICVPQRGAPPRLLWERFGSVIGFDAALLTKEPGGDNPSMGAHEAELLRRVNSRLGAHLPLRVPYREVVTTFLVNPALTGPSSPRIHIPDTLAEWVSERAEQTVRALQDAGLTVTGDLEELRPTGAVEGVDPDDVADTDMLELATQTIVNMLIHLRRSAVPKEIRKELTLEIKMLEATVTQLEAKLAASEERHKTMLGELADTRHSLTWHRDRPVRAAASTFLRKHPIRLPGR